MRPRVAIPVPNSKAPIYVMRSLPHYEHAVREAGGEPVIIDVTAPSNVIAQKVKTCDGVLLPGSPADVDPEKYGTKKHPKTAAPDALRDNADELLLQDAYNMRKPVFAICYGLQSLNVWRTGTLVQHLETAVNHDPGRKVAQAHEVEFAPDSRLASIFRNAGAMNAGAPLRIMVNSSHHQSADVPGDGLRVVAWCPDDGMTEALEGTAPDHFVLCVQWHPEKSYDSDLPSQALFAAFVKDAAEWHKRLATKQQDFESVPN